MTLVVQANPKCTARRRRICAKRSSSRFSEFISATAGARALLVLGFIFLYKLGDTMATTLSTSFFLDIGFNKTQIGVIAKTIAFWASLAGGIVGGVWLMKIGIARGLWIFGVLQIVSTLGFRVARESRAVGRWRSAALYGFETFATGLTMAAFIAYIASTTDPRYTATQFALFTSLASVPRTLASASSGFVVAQTGWFEYFMICTALRFRHVTVAENRALETVTMTVHALIRAAVSPFPR